MDAGAVFDKDWLKNSFETISSEEWRKSGKEAVTGGEAVCPECKVWHCFSSLRPACML
jgi:hypothetical protein